jgi:hypothetical protein
LAFYVESLANAVFCKELADQDCKKEIGKVEKQKELSPNIPELGFLAWSVRKFRAAYDGKAPLDDIGIQDLFTIRNKVFAHARERSTVRASDSSKITRIKYLKFENFPHFYGDFGHKHCELLLNEVRTFLKSYADLSSNISKELKDEFLFKSLE